LGFSALLKPPTPNTRTQTTALSDPQIRAAYRTIQFNFLLSNYQH